MVATDTRLHCGNTYLDLSRPQVMGVINLTDDSYYGARRYGHASPDAILDVALQMVEEGAAIIDIGAESTGAAADPSYLATQTTTGVEQQLERLLPVVKRLATELPVPISIDTSSPEVMQQAAQAGAGFINDVRALCEPGAVEMAAKLELPVCLMHMAHPHHVPSLDAIAKQNDFLLPTIKTYLQERIAACMAAGIPRARIVVDPGFGGGSFGKSMRQNLQLIKYLNEFESLGQPLLVGLSRKSFFGFALNIPVEERLPASLAATALSVQRGARIIRTHDVKATIEAVRITEYIEESHECV